jgi:hypothetical protein
MSMMEALIYLMLRSEVSSMRKFVLQAITTSYRKNNT